MITKCDKDKCYVKRSGSRTIQENVLMTIEEMLPRSFSHVVCQCKSSGGSGGFEAVLRVNVFSEEQAREWKAALETETKITWRKDRTYVTKRSKVLMKEDYRCQHNTKPRSSNATRRYASKNTDCPSQMKIIIHQSIIPDSERVCRISRSRDPHRWEFPTEVRLKHLHNHPLHDASALKHRDVSKEARTKIDSLLLSGLTPSAALKRFKADLKAADPANYESLCEDRALCPDTFWVFRRSYVLGRIPKRQRENVLAKLDRADDEPQLSTNINHHPPFSEEPRPSTNINYHTPSTPSGSVEDTDDDHNEDSSSEPLIKLRKVELQPPAAQFHNPVQNVDQTLTVVPFSKLNKVEMKPRVLYHDPELNVDQAPVATLRKVERQPLPQFHNPQHQQQHFDPASTSDAFHVSCSPLLYYPPGSSNVNVSSPVNDRLQSSVNVVHHGDETYLLKSMPSPANMNTTLETSVLAVSEASLRNIDESCANAVTLQNSMVAGHVSGLSLQNNAGVSGRNEKCLQNTVGACNRSEISLQSYICANAMNNMPQQNIVGTSSVNDLSSRSCVSSTVVSLQNREALLNANKMSLEKSTFTSNVNEMLHMNETEPRVSETRQESVYACTSTTRVNETSLLCQSLAGKLKALQDDWMQKVQENPAQYAEGLAAFVSNAQQVETPSHLLSAWHNFGK